MIINALEKNAMVPWTVFSSIQILNLYGDSVDSPTCEAKGSEMASTKKDRIMSSGLFQKKRASKKYAQGK